MDATTRFHEIHSLAYPPLAQRCVLPSSVSSHLPLEGFVIFDDLLVGYHGDVDLLLSYSMPKALG